jgi:hypothetical protein
MGIRTAQAHPAICLFITTNTHLAKSIALDHTSDKISDAMKDNNTMHVHSSEIEATIADRWRFTG